MLILDDFINKIETLNVSQKIYIGLSGGVDSMVLLHLLSSAKKLNANLDICAVHINHSLSNNSDYWEEFCKNQCKNNNINFVSYKVDASPNKGQSPEDAARVARQKVFNNLVATNDVLLLAHHMQDQAETVLYRLFRGAGVKGLSGIPKKTNLDKGYIFRPLLDVSKLEINNYAKLNNINYIEDESNNNNSFSRNFIRNKVLPLVAKKWPKAIEKINSASNLCLSYNDYVSENITNIYPKFLGSKANTLSADMLIVANEFVRNQVIRKFIEEQKKLSPSTQQLQRIFSEVILAKSDGIPQLKIFDYYITRYNKELYLLNVDPKEYKEINYSYIWNLKSTINLPDYCKPIDIFRFKLNDFDELEIKLGNYGSSGKKIFQKLKIPFWERNLYPLVFLKGKLLAIGDIWYNPKFFNNGSV